MIYITRKNNLPNTEKSIERLLSDRPKTKKTIQKLLFFLIREGPTQTIEKISSKLFKIKTDTKNYSIKISSNNGISYDGGNSFYISDIERDAKFWENPFSYDSTGELENAVDIAPSQNTKGLFMIGCGDYSRTYSLSTFKANRKIAAVDYNSSILNSLENKFDCVAIDISQIEKIWKNSNSPVALIASYHSDHAQHASSLYHLNKKAYMLIEKPPIVNEADIALINDLYDQGAKFEVGYNRRYAPIAKKVKEELAQHPKIISITVNEVKINEDHWYQWPNQGSRITGNACHWIDLCQWFIDSEPDTLLLNSSKIDSDDCNLSISYADGSLVNILLTDKGNDLRGVQENIEIKENNKTIKIEDFTKLTILDSSGRRKVKRYIRRDKGHSRMYSQFRDNIKSKEFQTTYPQKDFNRVSKVVLMFSQMLQHGEVQRKF